jgi:hypothetical protein
MKHFLFFLTIFVLMFCFPNVAHAGSGKGIHYKGGMQYHIRYAKLNLPETSISDIGMGLGGRAAINVTPYLRIGGMGFRSRWTYPTNVEKNNYIEIGFGGISLEYVIACKKFSFSAGICGGGGRVTYLHSITHDDPYSVVRYESETSMIVQPIATTEYKLTDRISAAVMFDGLYAQALPINNHFAPAIHFGILFGR